MVCPDFLLLLTLLVIKQLLLDLFNDQNQHTGEM